MSRGGRPLRGWARMWPLACALALAACSSVSPLLQETTSDPPIATETQTEVWTQPDHQTEAQTLAEFQTQPELQTEAQTVAQTQTELQTQPELQTESPTELESQAATINHTGESRVLLDRCLILHTNVCYVCGVYYYSVYACRCK